jgi:hypothetical protein
VTTAVAEEATASRPFTLSPDPLLIDESRRGRLDRAAAGGMIGPIAHNLARASCSDPQSIFVELPL